MMDIYFEHNYAKLYEKIENGDIYTFNFENKYGKISNTFIKRKIPIELDNKIYYDLITPYGYGGPIVDYCHDNDFKDKLIKEFNLSFNDYCISENIISEFIRFHPILNNAEDFKKMYEVIYLRNTVGTTIKNNEDPIKNEFSKSAQKSIRRALNSGMTYRINENPEDIGDFKKIYYSTMDRNNALDYYYFDDNYFENCLKNFNRNIITIDILYKDKVIAGAFYFFYNKTVHAHLSGTLKEYLSLSPAYVIKYATAIWAKEKGMDLIHYGGGTTNDIDDPLYKYKKKFTKNTEFKFFIGKKIWNKEVYRKLCISSNNDIDTNFFPAYRNNF